MINIALPNDKKRRLPFYLAAEEWVARMLPPDEYFFAWRVPSTVICGRNQIIANEVDQEYCRKNNIDVVRRKSGGGCVYADMNNYMFSYIAPSSEVMPTFGRYTSMIVNLLDRLGVEAHANGRNDIFVGQCKIAGNAFYRLPGRAIAHGTLLVDVDSATISKALTPSRIKRQAKGVASVASHVTSLRALGLTISAEDFGKMAVNIFCQNRVIVPSPEHIAQIEKIEKSYYDPSFLGDHLRQRKAVYAKTIERSIRIEGSGEFFVEIGLDKEMTIKNIDLQGDFFALDDFRTLLLQPLEGHRYEPEILGKIIEGLPVADAIAGLNAKQLKKIILGI